MIAKIAWKNIWRNKLRSSVVIGAIVFGLTGAIFIGSLTIGMMSDMVQSMINDRLGHIQIHNPSFILNQEVEFRFDDSKITDFLSKDTRIEGYTNRVSLEAIGQTALAVRGITLTGINPESENRVTNIKSKIIDGDFFEAGNKRAIVISKKLADTLDLKLGSKLISTFTDINGQVTSMNYRISGIYKTNNSMNDLVNVYVDINGLRKMIAFNKNESNEIAIRVKNTDQIDSVKEDLKELYGKLSVRRWEEVAPGVAASSGSMDTYLFIIIIIVLLALAFGIINTMLMAILERNKEICMLRACGMKKKNVMLMIIYETIFMTMLGGMVGNIIGFIIVQTTGSTGIIFSSFKEGFESVGVSATIHPQIDSVYYLYFTILVFITSIFASIFPAKKALKMNIAQTINSH
jgi:putative ABC transport system permease protein